ncbi:MAG: class F420-dependent oxidoreductase [Glaciihabitans sp.]|nr:class F420-dependent oxidoreductase [Glaciihabitans sp.]
MDFRIFTEPQEGASYNEILAVAQATERLGFDAFFRSDHYLAMTGTGANTTDAWTTLAGLARETARIKLGTLVSSVTYRVPGILAIQVAQVDQMSNGRAELGLGTGWFEREHTAYGIPFPAKRFGLLAEQLEIVTGLWATPPGETYSFTGEHYTLVDSPALPQPVQSPVPVIVGGGGKTKTPALAARFSTEYNSGFASVAEHAARRDRLLYACEEIGRDPKTITLSVAGGTAVAATTEHAERRARAADNTLDAMRESGFVGSVDEVVDRIGALGDLGYSRIYFQVMDMADLDHLDFLAREVVPRVTT